VAETENDDPDAPLVVRMQAGDERAFAEIVRRHGPRLRALALRFSGDRAAADDLLQETFLAAWRSVARFVPGGAPYGAYLTRVAVNRAIDGDRRRRLRKFFGLEAGAGIADPAALADDTVAGRQALAAVARDIKALPPRQRLAILLAADGERSNREIAAALGLSEGAAEQLLVRARRTLRQRLAEREKERNA
jgi:RNA polymerase sigma-70 factor (ECF subfamily)